MLMRLRDQFAVQDAHNLWAFVNTVMNHRVL